MRISSFSIPTASALTLLTTVACGSDPIVGTWDGVSGTSEDLTYSLPDTASGTYDNIDYSWVFTIEMSFDKDGGGELVQDYVYETDGVVSTEKSYHDIYTFAGLKQSKGTWALTIPFTNPIEMVCTADGDDLVCAGTPNAEGNDLDLILVRRSE